MAASSRWLINCGNADWDWSAKWQDSLSFQFSPKTAGTYHLQVDLRIKGQEQPVVLYIGMTLRDMWSCKLARDFPARQFEVVFPYENAVQIVDYQITFFQRR